MTIRPCDAIAGQRLRNRPGKLGQAVHVRHAQIKGMIIDKEEPVAAPGDVAAYSAETIDFNRHLTRVTVAWYVVESHRARFVQYRFDLANRCLDLVLAGSDSSKVSKRDKKPNCTVTTHAQVRHVVEENHACRARGVHWLAQERSHYLIGSTRLSDHGGAKPVVFGTQQVQAMRQRFTAKVRATLYDYPGGLAARM